ncbi:transglycosylase SLT domain-containing protein [Agrobacterium tumefaciens]|uniref:transglycosylase SLT domain-containing protein n=1 Tax=Agrobacterium tumefaciens TaxID=358 RepID=UPI0015742F6A|nr:transglycosylase SLT domain-containing protein [Agrobacterium tumefaciens]NTE37658.1 transglycosylase SLT domain-containing protein [Agrobacterium tumefaciens]NTE53170.1 transglycosylase SLT domain-containing protein [Agrobacterium tumefaciens]
MRLPKLAIASLLSATFLTCEAAAQIAVEDDSNLEQRKEDKSNNEKSAEKKTDETANSKSIVCTYSGKYRSEMFRRSPKDAMARDAENVAQIRYFAQKYGVSEGLALSVAYQESRFDSCAGSHTGVKGVMQLTKKTGLGLGFDRDINEENIEGGVKYLSMGVNKCGETNYACLAKFYNGSSAAEQSGWAGGVARWNGYFDTYVATGEAPSAAPPAISIKTTSGGAGKAQTGALGTISTAASNLERSAEKVGTNSTLIDGLLGNIGQTTEYKDAWELNSSARALQGGVLNQYLKQANDFTALLGQIRSLKNVEASQSAKTVARPSDGDPNPFTCDPAVLEKLQIDRSKWLPCAVQASNNQPSDGRSFSPNAQDALRNIQSLQNQE